MCEHFVSASSVLDPWKTDGGMTPGRDVFNPNHLLLLGLRNGNKCRPHPVSFVTILSSLTLSSCDHERQTDSLMWCRLIATPLQTPGRLSIARRNLRFSNARRGPGILYFVPLDAASFGTLPFRATAARNNIPRWLKLVQTEREKL